MMLLVLGAVLGYVACAGVALWRGTSRIRAVIAHIERLTANDEEFHRAYRLVCGRMTDRNLATVGTWWLNDPKVYANLEDMLGGP